MMKMTRSGLDAGSGGGGGGGASRDVSAPQVTLVHRVYSHLCFTSAYDNEFSGLRRLWKLCDDSGKEKTTTFFWGG